MMNGEEGGGMLNELHVVIKMIVECLPDIAWTITFWQFRKTMLLSAPQLIMRDPSAVNLMHVIDDEWSSKV
jgi:hypothetical protein